MSCPVQSIRLNTVVGHCQVSSVCPSDSLSMGQGSAVQPSVGGSARAIVTFQITLNMHTDSNAVPGVRPPDSVSVTLCRYQTEAAAQKEILQGFERDMDQLAALQLHPDIRTDRHNYLIDLIPEQKLREWAARCKRDHDHFAKKVKSALCLGHWGGGGRGRKQNTLQVGGALQT